MDKSREKKIQISKKAVSIIMLVSVFVISLIAISYAWYRNYVEIRGANLTTGKIGLEIKGYGVGSGGNAAALTPITVNGETESSVIIESAVTDIDDYSGAYHIYYFIKNPDIEGSSHIDASLSVSLDNSFISDELKGITVEVSEIRTNEMTGSLTDLEGISEEQIMSAIASGAGVAYGEPCVITDLSKAYTRISVPKGGYACVRVSYRMPDTLSGRNDLGLDFRASFCLANKDELPENGEYTEYMAYSVDGLRSALLYAHAGDKIIIKSNIAYVGDLIIGKPLTLDIQSSKLDISGSLICAYSESGRLCIDTSRGGSIAILKKNVEYTAGDGSNNVISTGGNLKIDTPFGYVELLGKNSVDITLGDIYVEGEMNVSASITSAGSPYGQGLIVNGANIYPIASERGDSRGYKELVIGARTRVLIMNYTSVGKISSASSVIEIENRGTVEKIDLSEMIIDPQYTNTQPQIYINNYGILTDGEIALPLTGTSKFHSNDDGTYSGNTRIVSQPGSGAMTVAPETDGFVSDGSRNPGTDHIEYVKLEAFVERVNGRRDEITVQYTSETGLYIPGTATDIGSSLETLLSYYAGEAEASEYVSSESSAYVNEALRIASASEIKRIKIVCLSTELTDADYEYIRSMSSLTHIDLSSAASVELSVPDEAFSGLSALESIVMSDFDNRWGDNILTGTGVDEIRIPDSLISVKSSQSLSGVKYAHTSARFVANISESNSSGILLFVPDLTTFQAYNTSENYGKVFYEAERYRVSTGDYFLRLDTENKTAELVAFKPLSYSYLQFDIAAELSGDAKFDFNSITVNNTQYSIVKYGTYSFYGKTFVNSADGEIVLGDRITAVEPYAFGNASGIDTLTVEGVTELQTDSFRGLKVGTVNITDNAYIGDNAFMSSSAVRVYAPRVTATGKNSFREMGLLINAYLPSLRRTNEPFYGCSNIYRLDISIFEKDTMFGQNSAGIKYTFIHTDESDVPESYTYTLAYTGIDATNNGSRFLFVPSSFASIYANYGTKIDIGDSHVDDIKEYFDAEDSNTVEYTNTYKVSEKIQFTHPNIYYLDRGDGTAEIIRFHKSAPSADTDIFYVPGEDGGSYTVTSLASYSYSGVSLTYDEFTFAPTITKVGDYAFSGTGKSIGILDLNNVEYVGRRAFENNRTAKVYGGKVEFMGNYAFVSNINLIYAYFPVWRSGEAGADTAGNYFNSCGKLRYAHIGPVDNGVQSNMFSGCGSLKFVTVDATSRLEAAAPVGNTSGNTAMFLIIGASTHGFGNARQVNADFSNLLAKGSVTYSVTVNDRTYSVDVPESLYRITDGGRRAELLKLSASSVNAARYVVPIQAIPTGETAEFFGHSVGTCLDSTSEGDSGIPVKSFAPNAYANVSFGETIFNTGPYITEITTSTFQGLSVKHIELENVISVGNAAFSGRGLVTVVANKLENIGYTAFQHCTSLKSIVLPAVKSLGGWTFWDTGLETVVLGENITSAGQGGDFADCPALREITILSDAEAVYKDGRLFYDHVRYPNQYMGTVEENVTLIVKAKHLEAAASYWSGVLYPLKEVKSYESKYVASDGVEYYYKEIADGKIELTHFKLPGGYTMGAAFTFPSELTVIFEDFSHSVYTVTQLHNSIFGDISEYAQAQGVTVNTVVLPSGLEALNDNLSVMPSTVADVQIASTNTVYKTVDGVVYSYDMSTLLYYPDGRTDEEFTIPSSVTAIANGAFRGNTYIRRIVGSSKMLIAGNAFKDCAALESITLTSVAPCMFIGAGSFDGCNSLIAIYAPAESVDDYRNALLFDFAVRDKITAIQP